MWRKKKSSTPPRIETTRAETFTWPKLASSNKLGEIEGIQTFFQSSDILFVFFHIGSIERFFHFHHKMVGLKKVILTKSMIFFDFLFLRVATINLSIFSEISVLRVQLKSPTGLSVIFVLSQLALNERWNQDWMIFRNEYFTRYHFFSETVFQIVSKISS